MKFAKNIIMKKVLIVALMAINSIGFGQDYSNAIGFRGGFSQGLTFKHFLGSNSAVEGILATRWKGFNLTGLYEIHANAFDVEGLNWYYGGGGHVGMYDGYLGNKYFNDPTRTYTAIGVDGILGIEYNIGDIPINISADWKPAFNLVGYVGFWGDNGAISIRYYF